MIVDVMIAGRCETAVRRIERLVEVSANETLLSSVKVYCDWMRINPHIIATCAKVCFVVNFILYRVNLLFCFARTYLNNFPVQLIRNLNTLFTATMSLCV